MSSSALTTSPLLPTPTIAASEPMPHQEAEQHEPELYKESLQKLPIQKKLTIGATDDPLEEEADLMADQVMRLPETFLQRKCEECEDEKEENIHRKAIDNRPPSFIQSKIKHTDNQPFIQQKASFLQFKLTVGAPDDQFEREADAVADKVLLMSESNVHLSTPDTIQAKCSHCEDDEEEIHRKGTDLIPFTPSENETILSGQVDLQSYNFGSGHATLQLRSPSSYAGELQLKPNEEEEIPHEISLKPDNGSDGGNYAPDHVESRLNQSKGGGNPLPETTRSFMESSIGADFSNVKIHDDSNAQQMSKDLHAQAFTHGSDIYFSAGKYNTDSSEGKHLLAHELTHVVQQNSGLQRKFIQRAPVDEPPKHSVIDYKKAKKTNLDSWYDQYKFFNLFKEISIYPGSTPIAYANHVYELQLKLEENSETKWMAKEAGILETIADKDSTLVQLAMVAGAYAIDPAAHKGFDTKMLDRLNLYYAGFESDAPPLVSEYFASQRQLILVNRNKHFHIQFDDRGRYVKQIQQALIALNYNIGSDLTLNKETKEKEPSGIFGKGTKEAVINFQKDSGFEGKDVDGVVGQMTLRLLDKRIGAPAFKTPTISAGGAYGFHVPVTSDDLKGDKETVKNDLLRRALKVAFPVTDDQVDVLVRSGWHWTSFDGNVSQSNVDLGYMPVSIRRQSYLSVIGKVDEFATEPKETIDSKVEKQALDLLKTSKLDELNKQIKEKEKLLIWLSIAGNLTEITKQEGLLEDLKKQRQVELNRLELTLDDYEKLKTDFISTFEKFALLTAFRMLSDNEMQANIESQHYANLKEVAALKIILADLGSKYKESETLWWEGVSLKDSGGRNKSLYKNASDYIYANTAYAGENIIDLTDPDMYYGEANAAKMYKAMEKNASPHFASWQEKEKAVVSTLQEAVKKFPILAYPKLSLRSNAIKDSALSETELQKKLLKITDGEGDEKGIKQNIESTREELSKNPSKIWELPVVIARAQYSLGLVDGIPADLIKAKQKAVADKGFWESIGLAILGIGLGLLALLSGPVGWLALAASIGVGAYDAYRTYNEITFKKELANTALDPANALGTEDPSYFWFWVSLVSVGIDVFQAARVIKSIGKGIDLAKDVRVGLEAAEKAASKRLLEAGGEATEKGKAIAKELEEIRDAAAKVNSLEFAENIKILEPLKANPMAVAVMSEALRDKKIVKAVTSLGKMVDKEVFETALKFYGSVGRRSLDELPELMRLVKEGGLETNKRLMAELLSDPRSQRALLDTQDPKFFAAQYSAWEAAIKAGESKSFINFLEAENLTTKLAQDTKLADMFGEAFTSLSNTVKNRQILRTVEPRILDALNAGTLSPELKRALEVMLNSDILAQSTRLSSAQERLLRELRLLGSVIETQTDFSKIVSLLDSSASRRALWEGASQLAGKDKYIEIILKANGGKMPAADVLDDLIRIGPMTDEGTVQSLLTPAGQKLRQALAASPEAVAVLKKCASPCLPAFVTPEQVAELAEIMKGKSKDDLLRIREYIYANRGSADTFQTALSSLKSNAKEALKDTVLPVLTKPAALSTVADETLRIILDLGLPVSELNKILKKAGAATGGKNIILDLMRVLQFEKNVSLKNFDVLLKGLAEGTDAEFKAARLLLDESARFANASVAGLQKFKYSGLQKADILLGRFTLAEIHALSTAARSEGFVNTLFEVLEKVPTAKNADIVALINKAGGGKAPGNLGRLAEILETVKAPTSTVDEVTATIEAADRFAAEVAKAMKDPATGYDAMVKLIWGETVAVEKVVIDGVEKSTIKVQEAIGKSAGDAERLVTQLGKGESLAKNMASAGVLHKERWKVFRKVIEDSNIADITKNKIIGKMWEDVMAEFYKGAGYVVHREVRMIAGKTVARADLIIEKGFEIIVVECKTGKGVLTEGQDIVYPLLEQGKFTSIMLSGDEALAAKFIDPKYKIKYVQARELDMIK